MKHRGQALTFLKCPFGDKTHCRAEEENLSLSPRWENGRLQFTQHWGQSRAQSLSLESECGDAQAEQHAQAYARLCRGGESSHHLSLTTHLPLLTHSDKPCQLSYKGMGWRKDFCLTRSALARAGIPLSIRVESYNVHRIGCVGNQPLQVHCARVSWHHNLERRKCQILLDSNSNAYQVFY